MPLRLSIKNSPSYRPLLAYECSRRTQHLSKDHSPSASVTRDRHTLAVTEGPKFGVMIAFTLSGVSVTPKKKAIGGGKLFSFPSGLSFDETLFKVFLDYTMEN